MEVIRFEKKYLNDWEEFVKQSSNGTIFHTRKFLSYHASDKFNDSSLIFTDKNKIVSVLTAVSLNRDGKNILSSHQGASFGGFVYKDNLSISLAFDLTESLIDFGNRNNINRLQITHSPFVYHTRYNNYIDFAFIQNGFQYLKREVSSIVPLPPNENELFNLFKAETRTSTRRAIKMGVEIRKTEDYKTYYDILKNNLNMRHNVQPAHTLDELKKLKNMYPDEIELLGAYVEDKMIAGVVNFFCNEKVVLVFYISHNPEYQQYRGVNLLFYETMKRAIEKRINYLDFGLFTVNMEPNWGLGKFKESFGARGILRDYFYLDLN